MATIIIGGIVFICIGLVAYNTYRSSKNGTGCSGGCSGCDKAKECH
ncbi:MAG: FeoB-associated Cys-rich membrane protein [Clostridioides difficile]|nr:FeoB-associated Cys-rich membrane protein [Clostridioides sp.]MBS5787353.1 FeoB-associated Cys-rich membrane protein [Clostridioides difficile]